MGYIPLKTISDKRVILTAKGTVFESQNREVEEYNLS